MHQWVYYIESRLYLIDKYFVSQWKLFRIITMFVAGPYWIDRNTEIPKPIGICQKLWLIVSYVEKKIKKLKGCKPLSRRLNPLKLNNLPKQFGHGQKQSVMVPYD